MFRQIPEFGKDIICQTTIHSFPIRPAVTHMTLDTSLEFLEIFLGTRRPVLYKLIFNQSPQRQQSKGTTFIFTSQGLHSRFLLIT